MKTKEFRSFEEYEKFVEEFSDRTDVNYHPVIIDDGFKVTCDMFINCKKAITAVKRFAKAFEKSEAVTGWIETIEESVINGYFKDENKGDKYGYYSWEVESVDEDVWYIFLTAAGGFAGR